MVISFQSIDKFQPGTIFQLVLESYGALLDCFPNKKQRLIDQWHEEDQTAFDSPGSIGNCVLFTCMDNIPIGYFSWDDRNFPVGIIGQNCVLPGYRRNGYGKKQIEKITQLFWNKNFSEIRVTTGNHDFFIPAQNMYHACGFKFRDQMKWDLFETIEFYKELR